MKITKLVTGSIIKLAKNIKYNTTQDGKYRPLGHRVQPLDL